MSLFTRCSNCCHYTFLGRIWSWCGCSSSSRGGGGLGLMHKIRRHRSLLVVLVTGRDLWVFRLRPVGNGILIRAGASHRAVRCSSRSFVWVGECLNGPRCDIGWRILGIGHACVLGLGTFGFLHRFPHVRHGITGGVRSTIRTHLPLVREGRKRLLGSSFDTFCRGFSASTGVDLKQRKNCLSA